MKSYKALIDEIRQCELCKNHLPDGPRPVVQFHPKSKILIAGQAPGRKVHESGIPFDDASGNRLREWMGISHGVFYDPEKIAILPMGFCYPGTGKSGDLPPRPECVEAWRSQVLDQLKGLQLILVLGQYAQAYHFKDHKGPLTELVKSWKSHWPDLVPLPHPSPRNNRWLKQNPWFEVELIPSLKQRVSQLLK